MFRRDTARYVRADREVPLIMDKDVTVLISANWSASNRRTVGLHGMVWCPEGEAHLVDGVQGRAEVSPVMGVLGVA